MGTSPAQRMLSRRTKSILPTTEKQLTPRGGEFIKLDQSRMKQEQQRNNYDKTAKDLEMLNEGDTIRLKPFRMGKKEWEKGVVRKRLDDRTTETPPELFQAPNHTSESAPPSSPSPVSPPVDSTPEIPPVPQEPLKLRRSTRELCNRTT